MKKKYEIKIIGTSRDYISLFAELEKVVKLLHGLSELKQISIVEMDENEGYHEDNIAY